MPEYVNPHGYTVHLPGPDGKPLKVKPRQRVVLSEFFEKYVGRGFLKRAAVVQSQPIPAQPATGIRATKIQSRIRVPGPAKPTPAQPAPPPKPKREDVSRTRKLAIAAKIARKSAPPTHLKPQKQVVGRTTSRDPNELLRINLAKNNYPVSNNIGVGILSYNRSASLRRLVDSIVSFTDLRRTTVFISDDHSDDPETIRYLDELTQNPNFVILRNEQRLGIAGNSNRLLRCLSRFKYGLLLNDDVEVLNHGWEYFYPEVMSKSGLCHLMYRQPGVYGAQPGVAHHKNGVVLSQVLDKPHGAVLAFEHSFLDRVGYFDEGYGLYGMEHVDWSRRAWEFGLQEEGFFDAAGSDRFFHLYSEASSVTERSRLLKEAKARFDGRTGGYVAPSDQSRVPEIAYVVPFRDFERTDSICTVIHNLRAQRFPVVHLIMVEQDLESQIDLQSYQPVQHFLARAAENPLFNKSRAFNLGVSKAPCEMVILHDADMLAQGHYTQAVANILKDHESCHIGSNVIYTNQDSMRKINHTGIVDHNVQCERVVGYYEGGSLAATKKGYWKVGGFNEDYWGYGCEDCDFYARLSGASKWKEDRVFDFLHLWHSRVSGWNGHHDANKALEKSLKVLPIPERVQKQREQLRRIGYARELEEALK